MEVHAHSHTERKKCPPDRTSARARPNGSSGRAGTDGGRDALSLEIFNAVYHSQSFKTLLNKYF
jgi:hypothetical protein